MYYFRPPLFIHRSKLHSIAVGRGGGSRYIDLHATLDDSAGDKTEIEFTNIDREEMTVLNSYIHDTLVKAMAKDVKEGDNEKDGDENEEANLHNSTDDEDEDDADDDAFQMGTSQSDDDEDDSEGNVKEEGSLSETSQPSRKRSRRQAATDSRKATKYDLENTSNNPTDENNSDSDEDDDDDDYEMVEKKEDSSEDEGDTDDNASASDGTVSEDNEDE